MAAKAKSDMQLQTVSNIKHQSRPINKNIRFPGLFKVSKCFWLFFFTQQPPAREELTSCSSVTSFFLLHHLLMI